MFFIILFTTDSDVNKTEISFKSDAFVFLLFVHVCVLTHGPFLYKKRLSCTATHSFKTIKQYVAAHKDQL